jgi:hypothetical protein
MTGQSHYEGEEARKRRRLEGLTEGVAVCGLEAFVFDAGGTGFVLLEQIQGEAADDGEGSRRIQFGCTSSPI